MRGFVHRHRAQSPYFSDIPKEFLSYLAESKRSPEALPPFAWELCHYQWAKRALAQAPDADFAADDRAVELDDKLSLSPLAWPLRYDFPVQRIGTDFQPAEAPPQPTYLIAYRNRQHEVRFMSSNATTVRLLELIDEGNDVRRSLETIAEELRTPLERIERFGLEILHRLQEHDIVRR